MTARMRLATAILVCVAAAATLLHGQDPRLQPIPIDPDREEAAGPPFECGTSEVLAIQLGLKAATAMASGEPVSFMQDPPLLGADFTGTFTLRDFLVVGDKPEVRFKRNDPDRASDNPNIETWTRTGTRTIDGQIVSIFNPSWPDSEFARILRRYSYGFDNPSLYWGQVIVTLPDLMGGAKEEFRVVFLRMKSSNLPSSRVNKISDTVQYASHVVNLVISNYGDARVAGGSFEFQEEVVTKRFYEHFQDAYDVIAIIPQRTHIGNFGAFHFNVKNQVQGIGTSIRDDTATYGSGGTLQGVEVYPQVAFATNSTSNHEIAHQWGNHMNWDRIAGITRAGHAPTSHAPLWGSEPPRETMIGAVLKETRRVKRSVAAAFFPIPLDGSEFEIERTPAPVKYHPIEMYAMGKLAQDQVPSLFIFEDQGQFDPDTSSEPDPGKKLTGGVKTVTINDIIREHGTRSGPSPSEWRRATVVVSRDGLLPQEQMDFWNFYAQRLEDRERLGVTSYSGVVGFDAATNNTVDLKTDINPKAAALGANAGYAIRTADKIDQPLDVSFPKFGTRDWRDVEFDNPVPSRYKVGERVTISGRITATDRSDFDAILLYFYKYGGTAESAVRFDRSITGNRFTADIQFTEAQKGTYMLGVYLFWPSSGGQAARSHVTPVVVE